MQIVKSAYKTSAHLINDNHLLKYIQQQLPCKFRFKSGKIIYGIIWESYDEEKRQAEYFFASVAECISKEDKLNNIDFCRKYMQRINIEDVIGAEILRIAA